MGVEARNKNLSALAGEHPTRLHLINPPSPQSLQGRAISNNLSHRIILSGKQRRQQIEETQSRLQGTRNWQKKFRELEHHQNPRMLKSSNQHLRKQWYKQCHCSTRLRLHQQRRQGTYYPHLKQKRSAERKYQHHLKVFLHHPSPQPAPLPPRSLY